MAVQFRVVSAAGQNIKKARLARKWSRERLAKESGVSTRTIDRVEKGQGEAPRSIDALEQALGIGAYEPTNEAEMARSLSGSALAAELVRRLTEAEEILSHARIGRGETPPGLASAPTTLRPPANGQGSDKVQSSE